MSIKKILKKIVWGPKASSESYIAYLRSIGVRIGEGVTIYAPMKTVIDEQYPWMITIGNNVKITQGVVILTHDYSWSVLKHAKNGAVFGASGTVNIGDNVFIGMNSIIVRGVTIGNNVIIGAGSVVTKDCLDNGVYAGNPARKIAELDVYFEKRRDVQLEEAKKLAHCYYSRFGKYPPEEVFHEYFMLFTDSKSAKQRKYCSEKTKLGQDSEETIGYLSLHPPLFKGYEAFMEFCFAEKNNEKN